MTDPVEIRDYLRSMQTDQNELRHLITQIMWHMRGSLSRQEAWTLSLDERKDIIKLIEERRELTEKTGMPLL
jgi:hypothetical protein